jgi:hypothetical protein
MTPDEKHDTNIINTFNKNDCNCKLEKILLQKVNIGFTNGKRSLDRISLDRIS